MIVTIDVAGTPVSVELPEDRVQGIRRDAETAFTRRIVEAFIHRITQNSGDELTEDEVETVWNEYIVPTGSPDDFIADLVSGKLYATLEEKVNEVVNARAKYYTVRIRATQDFDIVVKATSADEAEDYADRLDYTDLSDYLADYDHEFETLEVESPGLDTLPQNRSTDYFDATED